MAQPFDELPNEDRLYRMRHSCAHVMAEAVLELFPGAKFAIGPPIEHGFYYDLDLPRPLAPEDLGVIEERMHRSIDANYPFEHREIDKEEARHLFAVQPYKLELIEGIEGGSVSLYQHASFTDLCEGPGHWAHFKDDMFPPMELEHEELVLRPMNCPHHIMIYAQKKHSYRELPIRLAELGTMYRYERSGVVAGLSRVRAMTLNDAHIFCTPAQVKHEFSNVMRLVEKAYATLGITEYSYQLSLRDPENTEKYAPNDEMWQMAESVLREAMNDLGLPYTEAVGEAAFYGPKLDINLRDLLGRGQTISTVPIALHLPNQVDLIYIGEA